MRRIWLLAVVSAVATLQAQQAQPPIFRGGTNRVQIDAIVTDDNRRPLTDLAAADFELQDDGRPMAIDTVRFLGSADYAGDSVLAPIRTHEDEEREAGRDDVRVYAILLDDYHVPRLGELRVIEPLLAFIRTLPPTDLVAVYFPLDSVTDVAFSRDRAPVEKKIRAFYGRLGDYAPTRPVEEEHLRHPRDIEEIRRRIVTSALEGLSIHLGAIKQGRKSVIFVSEAFTEPDAEMRDIYEAANRSNVAIYPLDPRGLSTEPSVGRGASPRQVFAMVSPARDFMRVLAAETGGRPMFSNDVKADLGQVIRDSRAYYLIAYESPHPDDGKFHRVTVNVKRPRASIFARTGYWAYKRGENTLAPSPALNAVPVQVQTAVDRLADSLRPDADEPGASRRRVAMPSSAPEGPAPPTVAVARGRTVGEPVSRREFRRTDTIVVRFTAAGTASANGRLLDRRGQLLTDLPLTPGADVPELRLPLGNLGPGDYVVELAQQYIAFRLVR